jgi:hypothetical protein
LVTGVINPHRPHKRSRALTASFFKQIRPAALATSQLPASVVDATGHKISKPRGW